MLTTFFGQPLSSTPNIFLISSILWSLRLVQIIKARCTNLDIRPFYVYEEYWPVNVGFAHY